MSGYFWNDKFFENPESYEEIKKTMEENLSQFSQKLAEFTTYRFGLNGENIHSRSETAEYFSIPLERIPAIESAVLHQMGLRMPTPRSRSSRLRKYLEGDS